MWIFMSTMDSVATGVISFLVSIERYNNTYLPHWGAVILNTNGGDFHRLSFIRNLIKWSYISRSKSQIFHLAKFETKLSYTFWLSILLQYYSFLQAFKKNLYMPKGNNISYNKKKGENSILWLKGALCILVLDSSIFKGGHSYKFSKDSNVWIWYYPDPYPP